MFRFESWDSDRTSASDVSTTSFGSLGSADLSSVFGDETKEPERKSEELKSTAQQLAVFSASQHFPTFHAGEKSGKCAMMHWACHVGWCLCKYQYQPLTPLHLLPNTPITDNCQLRYCMKRQKHNEPNKELQQKTKSVSSTTSNCDITEDAKSNIYFDTQLYSVNSLQNVDIFSMETSV